MSKFLFGYFYSWFGTFFVLHQQICDRRCNEQRRQCTEYNTQNPRIDREQLDEIVDILLETVCTNRKSIRVAGDDYPAELVKAKFLKLDSHHIEFVIDCLRDNTTKVRNIKQYLRAMLFNAPSTINSYYASLVAHDMAQPDWGRPPNT